MAGVVGVVQKPVQTVPFNFSEVLTFWHTQYSDVLRLTDPNGVEYVVLGNVLGSSPSFMLDEVLGKSVQALLDYLDVRVTSTGTPGDQINITNRWYSKTTYGGQEVYITPWQYLYNIELEA